MEGPDGASAVDNDNDVGMIPRAVMQVFETAAELADKGWQVSCLFLTVIISAGVTDKTSQMSVRKV